MLFYFPGLVTLEHFRVRESYFRLQFYMYLPICNRMLCLHVQMCFNCNLFFTNCLYSEQVIMSKNCTDEYSPHQLSYTTIIYKRKNGFRAQLCICISTCIIHIILYKLYYVYIHKLIINVKFKSKFVNL